MDKKVVETIRRLGEKTRFMKGLLSWGGYKVTVFSYQRPCRKAGATKQSWRSLFQLAFDGIFSVSAFPLRVWSVLGGLVAVLAFIYGLWIVVEKVFIGIEVPGYSSLMVILLFFNGLLMLSVGVLGEYISRIFDEVKGRPIYVVEETFSGAFKELNEEVDE